MIKLKAKRDFFNGLVPTWDLNSAANSRRVLEICKTFLPPLQAPILDLGSGTGVLLPVFKQLDFPPGQVFELDIARNMLYEARNRHPELSAGFVVAEGAKLPVRTGTIGTVFCFQVFPHFDDKRAALSEIYSTMRSGGRLIILHMMDHRQLNTMHTTAGRAVADDRILAADQLAILAQQIGFTTDICREGADLYLLVLGK